MPVSIDATGITIETFDEILSRLQDAWREIYGSDINVDQDSPDGQMLGILAKEILDGQEFGVSLYNSFDPNYAIGQQLNKILKIAGLTRTPATKSTVSLNITTTQSVSLPSDYTVSDQLGQNWVINAAQTIPSGTTAVSFSSQDYGAISADAGTIDDPVTIILGVDSVTNPLAASPGIEEETDIAVRSRRVRSVENPSYSTIGDLIARLLQINGVVDAIVYENDTDVLDAVRNIEAHTIWVIVDGGSDENIAEAIAKSKTGGTGLKGSTTAIFTEEIVKPNGQIRDYVHSVKFDRPTETEIYIRFDVTPKVPGDPIDTDTIKAALVDEIFTINEDVTVTSLYGAIYNSGVNGFIASALEVSDDDITYVTDILTAGYDEKFVVTTAKITITVV